MVIPSSTVVDDLAPYGHLRASINLGNPVLAQGSPDAPTGVTVDIAHEVAARLGVQVRLLCFDAARKSYEALAAGDADLCFLAVEPAREADVAFTAPYVVIDGVYAVPVGSGVVEVADVDRPGVRVGVKLGSAYDLFLTRTLGQASLVRADDGFEAFRSQGLEVVAGIRAPLAALVAANPDLRLIPGRFMQIQQAVGTARTKQPATIGFLHALVEELKVSGFIADSLRRSGQSSAEVAAPAPC